MSEDTKPRYNINDQVTISRGKLRGETGTVIAVDTTNTSYAVQLTSGLKIVAFSAVKPRTEPTITAGQLAEVLNAHEGQYPDAILAGLEAKAPGITADVQLASVSVHEA